MQTKPKEKYTRGKPINKTSFLRNQLENGICYHIHGQQKHKVPLFNCLRMTSDTCESVAHSGRFKSTFTILFQALGSTGCPLELVDYNCDGYICELGGEINGRTWDGKYNCDCISRLMTEKDIQQ